MKITNIDNIRDIAIKCVDKMVKKGIIKDCIDTDDTTEFDIQDIITDTLLKEKLFKNRCVECDSYLDYSELKDKMCSKCGATLFLTNNR